MSNKSDRPAKPSRPSARSAPSSGAPLPAGAPKRNLLWLWVGLGAVVVLALGFAVVSSGDDEDLSVGSVPGTDQLGSVVTTAADGSPGQSQGEVWPVTVTGTPLEAFTGEGTDPAIGQTAPTMSGFTFDGSPVTIDPSKGPVMLVYLAHWCPHCNREVPELLQWKASGTVPADLQVVAVTTAVDPTRPNYPPSKWIVDMQWTWPVLADSQTQDAAVAMGLTSYPFVVILDTDGKVLTRWAAEKGADGIQELVDAALA
jgi:cytochrome c biogenesis protein CcmG, thiol:disulfide interchange protein DsbE